MRTVAAADWTFEGIEKFGQQRELWQFECPVCGNKQSGVDFLPYRQMGATPSTAYQQCIGRFNGRKDDASLPGCLFSVSTQPDAAPVEIEYGPGHSMRVMEFAEE